MNIARKAQADGEVLGDFRDQEMVLQAFKRSRAIWQIMVKLGVADAVEALPGPLVQTDEQIMQYISESMITVRHTLQACINTLVTLMWRTGYACFGYLATFNVIIWTFCCPPIRCKGTDTRVILQFTTPPEPTKWAPRTIPWPSLTPTPSSLALKV